MIRRALLRELVRSPLHLALGAVLFLACLVQLLLGGPVWPDLLLTVLFVTGYLLGLRIARARGGRHAQAVWVTALTVFWGVVLARGFLVETSGWTAHPVLTSVVVLALATQVVWLRRRLDALTRDNGALRQALRHARTLGAAEHQEVGRLRERGRIAQEVHDTLSQQLAAAGMLLRAAGDSLSGLPGAEQARSRLAAASELNDVALVHARQLVHGESFGELAQGGLPQAVSSFLDLVRRSCALRGEADGHPPVEFALRVRGEPVPLPMTQAGPLLRIVQQGVTNACLHAQARHVRVELLYLPDELLVGVVDDGTGFAVPSPDAAGPSGGPPGGLGLKGMRLRAAEAGARLEIDSRRGRGTVLTVTLPRYGTPPLSDVPGLRQDASAGRSPAR